MKMQTRFLLSLGFLVSISPCVYGQETCLQITKLPKPETPAERIIVADDISVGLHIEFKSDGRLGSIGTYAGGLDRNVDNLVLEAAKGIEFKPKQLSGKPETIERRLDYTYSYKTRDWTITPGAGRCLTQSSLLTDAEENLLKKTAKRFVTRLNETHDLRSLVPVWFVAWFEPIAGPEIDFVGDKLFASLKTNERRRVFFAFWNYLYIRTVIDRSKPENLECYDESEKCDEKNRQVLLRVLSPDTLAGIEAREKEGDPEDEKAATKSQLFSDLSMMERVFDEASPIVKARKLEQTPEFKRSIKLFEDDWNLNYLVKDGRADKTYRNRRGKILIKKGENIFGVETPLMIRVDFVKRGNEFKIFNLGAGDGD